MVDHGLRRRADRPSGRARTTRFARTPTSRVSTALVAIFSRRSIQAMLDHNATSIGAGATKRHAQRLNRCDEQSLAVEWEVAVLYALSRLGTVLHEPALGGTARLDFAFDGPSGITFCGDVATVTDAGVSERNPLVHFEEELRRR